MPISLGLGTLLGGVASGLLGAGASVGSNIANKKAQESANKANLQIAQMNNEFNERMLQKQMDYNTDMWNKQNEYNTAQAQVQRLREAGLNPAIALGNVSPGVAQSAQGVNTPTASPVQVNPAQYDFSGIASSLQYALDYGLASQMNRASIDKTIAEADAVKIDNKTRLAQAIANLENLNERTKGERERRRNQQIQNLFAADLNESQLREINSRIANNRQSVRNQIKAEMLMDKELQYFDKKSQQELANIAADVALKLQQKRNLSQQEKTEIQRTLETLYSAEGKKLSNQQIRDTYQYIINTARNNSYGSNPYGWANDFTTRLKSLFK